MSEMVNKVRLAKSSSREDGYDAWSSNKQEEYYSEEPGIHSCDETTVLRMIIEYTGTSHLPMTKNTAHQIIIMVKLPATHSSKQCVLCLHS